MSPELLYPELFGLRDSYPTKESDCYALGMVMYEVLSGQKPFAQSREPAVVRKVINGERPGWPCRAAEPGLADGIWRMVELCWDSQPKNRPDVKTVLQCLERVSEHFRLPSPSLKEDLGTDANDQSRYSTVSDVYGMFSRFVLSSVTGLITE